jgi:hypothetical protein
LFIVLLISTRIDAGAQLEIRFRIQKMHSQESPGFIISMAMYFFPANALNGHS